MWNQCLVTEAALLDLEEGIMPIGAFPKSEPWEMFAMPRAHKKSEQIEKHFFISLTNNYIEGNEEELSASSLFVPAFFSSHHTNSLNVCNEMFYLCRFLPCVTWLTSFFDCFFSHFAQYTRNLSLEIHISTKFHLFLFIFSANNLCVCIVILYTLRYSLQAQTTCIRFRRRGKHVFFIAWVNWIKKGCRLTDQQQHQNK